LVGNTYKLFEVLLNFASAFCIISLLYNAT
jgi:hypothetical protein